MSTSHIFQQPGQTDTSDASDGISELPANPPLVNESLPDCDRLVIEAGRSVGFNGFAVAVALAQSLDVAFRVSDRSFYRYNSSTGLWEKFQPWLLRDMCAKYLRQIAHHDSANRQSLLLQVTQAVISGILGFLKGCAPMGETSPLHAHLLPVANGVLDLSCPTPVLLPYCREYWFTSKIDYAYEPNSLCPRFVTELVGPALADISDLWLVQRILGSLLFNGNSAQRIIIIYGPGGSGKSTLISLIETIIGRHRFADLRTDTSSRFETGFYRGRSILVAKDEQHDFLARSGAAMLKRLTGGDWIEIEVKGGGKEGLQETFHVLISANTRLPIAINDDASAWRRRILPIHFNRSAPERKIPRFDAELLREEGEGILAWLIVGYLAHKRDLDELGDFRLTDAQKRRIDDWVLESQAQRHFAETGIALGRGDLSGAEIYEAFVTCCLSRGWRPMARFHFERALEAIMAEVHGVVPNHDLKRNGKNVRGYKGVKLITPDSTAA